MSQSSCRVIPGGGVRWGQWAWLAAILLVPPAGRGGGPASADKALTLGRIVPVSSEHGDGQRVPGGWGTRLQVEGEEASVPLVVVSGSPYEMGWHVGRLLKREIRSFLPSAVRAVEAELELGESGLRGVWSTTAAYTDDRVERELLGLASGSGVPLETVQAAHALPLVLPYSCSSIAAWGDATADGRLYQTRDLDWDLSLGAHEVPVVLLFLPRDGIPHAVPSFAGFLGAHCGMNASGIVLSEMGDSPAREMPYQYRAPHFTTWFRTLLYDAQSLTQALETFRALPMTKRYHFVFGDGREELRAVKIRAHGPEAPGHRLRIWGDNDPNDEWAPNVLPGVVYQDEGRGAFPTLKARHGALDAAAMVELCNQIPIRGDNVMNAVFDATGFRLWVAYAKGDREAYQRPYVGIDLSQVDGDGNGVPDISEVGRSAAAEISPLGDE